MLLLLALSAIPVASADELVQGNAVRIYYDSVGTWNDQDAYGGFQALHGGEWVDWSYWGYPWQLLAFEYATSDGVMAYVANSNTSTASCSVSGEADLSTADWAISSYTYSGESLEMVQTQAWQRDGSAVRVNYHLTAGTSALSHLAVYFEVDPDPDGGAGDYTTQNDVLDTDGDGFDDLVVSVSNAEGYTLAFGACSPATQHLGHNATWSYATPSANPTLTDNEGAAADSAMGIQMAPGVTMAPGDEGDLTFVVIEGTSLDDVEAQWAATDLCGSCDADRDGHQSTWCGGDDCDDDAANAYPGAREVWYDGVDEDCNGGSDYDQDGDGYELASDCDDTDSAAYPGAPDPMYDGVDSNCDGQSDYDADGDGYDSDEFGGDDCNDHDAAIHPGATEIYYDDIDQDCDGNDDDADGDGFDSPLDCDDTNPDIYPGAPGVNGDGVDSDCDGSDDDVAASTDDTAGAIKVDGGCACATGGGNAAGAAVLVAGLILAARRRR